MGYSKDHATNVGYVLTVTTKSITLQSHMVYDDYFSTVSNEATVPLPNWMVLPEKSRKCYLDHSVNVPALDNIWFNVVELAEH